jgi:hypothetical protein
MKGVWFNEKNDDIALLILLLLVVGMAEVAGARSYDVTVWLKDEEVIFPDPKPFIDSNDRTLVPIRFIAEKMGAEVDWEESISVVNGPGITLESTIDLKMGDEFEFPVATNNGGITYTIMRKGSGAGLSLVSMHIPTGKIEWGNK